MRRGAACECWWPSQRGPGATDRARAVAGWPRGPGWRATTAPRRSSASLARTCARRARPVGRDTGRRRRGDRQPDGALPTGKDGRPQGPTGSGWSGYGARARRISSRPPRPPRSRYGPHQPRTALRRAGRNLGDRGDCAHVRAAGRIGTGRRPCGHCAAEGLPAVVLRLGTVYGRHAWHTQILAQQARQRAPRIIGEGKAYWSLITPTTPGRAIARAVDDAEGHRLQRRRRPPDAHGRPRGADCPADRAAASKIPSMLARAVARRRGEAADDVCPTLERASSKTWN